MPLARMVPLMPTRRFPEQRHDLAVERPIFFPGLLFELSVQRCGHPQAEFFDRTLLDLRPASLRHALSFLVDIIIMLLL